VTGLPGNDLESDKSWVERKPLANCPIKGAEANLPPVSWGVHEGRKEETFRVSVRLGKRVVSKIEVLK